ncbi:citrate/2-methylcitrate synthase, partial [Psychrobacter sp. 1U2]
MADNIKSNNEATLVVDGKEYQLPIIHGTLGRPVVDVAALQEAGYWSYDPGFKVTAPVESKITFIDGGKGELLHRGYPIDELANNAEYLEVAYALIHGDLPNKEQKADFFGKIRKHSGVHDQLRKFFEGFRRDAHPMAIMVGVVGALS